MTDRDVSFNESGNSTSSSLLQRVRSMDEEAWGRFVHLYSSLVYHWCRRCGLQDADAADVHQEVFRAVHKNIGQFRDDHASSSFRGWLRVVTANKVRDFGRKNSWITFGDREPPAVEEMASSMDSGQDLNTDPNEEMILYRRAVEIILSEVKEDLKQAFLRVVAHQENPADVAQDLGISVNAVYLAKSRIMRRIREEFAELLDLTKSPDRIAKDEG